LEEYKIKILPEAVNNLDGIYGYIANHFLERKIAEKMINDLEEQILSLSTLPNRFPERQIGHFANQGYRQLEFKNYLVIYRVDEITKEVFIITVRYSHSDF